LGPTTYAGQIVPKAYSERIGLRLASRYISIIWILMYLSVIAPNHAQFKQFLALHREGYTQREIVEELGLSAATIHRRLKEANANGNLIH
jgi:hypothetical protein